MNNAFDRVIWNEREKPLSTDNNVAGSQLDRTIRSMTAFAFRPALLPFSQGGDAGAFAVNPGFWGSSFRVRPTPIPSMTLTMDAGFGFAQDSVAVTSAVGGIVGLDDLSSFKPIVLTAAQVLTVPASDALLNRIDIVEVRYDRRVENPLMRLRLNTTTGRFEPAAVNKTLSYVVDGLIGTVAYNQNSTAAIGYKTGLPAAPATVPATTAGYIKVAEILVPATATTVSYDFVKDTRRLLFEGGVGHASIEFAHKASAGAGTPNAATDMKMICSPGVQMGITLTGNPTGDVFVFAGDLRSGSNPAHVAAQITAGSGFNAHISSIDIHDVSAGTATSLSDITQSSPVLLVPSFNGTSGTGQSVIRVRYELTTSVGGTPLPNPTTTRLHVAVSWRYYA